MAATTKKAAGAGFRHVQVYELDSYGLGKVPAGDADTAYDGIHMEMAKALSLTIPDPQNIVHSGDDRVMQVDLLPPTEGVTGELRTGQTNLEIDAILSNVKVVEFADMVSTGYATDQQGKEPVILVMGYRQAVVTDPSRADKGTRCWVFTLLPKALVLPKAGAQEEGGTDENTYTVQPKVVSAYPWLIAFVCATEGFLETQMLRGVSQYRPHLAYWKGDNSELQFDFTLTPAAITKVKVYHWVKSTETSSDVTGSVTITTTEITFVTAPADGDIVIAFYEIADAVC